MFKILSECLEKNKDVVFRYKNIFVELENEKIVIRNIYWQTILTYTFTD